MTIYGIKLIYKYIIIKLNYFIIQKMNVYLYKILINIFIIYLKFNFKIL